MMLRLMKELLAKEMFADAIFALGTTMRPIGAI